MAQDVNNPRISNLNTWTIAEPLSTILRAGFCALYHDIIADNLPHIEPGELFDAADRNGFMTE